MNPRLFQLYFYFLRLFWPKIQVSATYPLAQAYHESDAWRSPLYLTGQNMFGMKPATSRSSTAIGTIQIGTQTYAKFRSDFDSIRDFFKRLDYFKIYTEADILNDIKTRYATDGSYFKKVEAVRLKLAPTLFPVSLVRLILGGATLGTIYAAYCGLDALADA